MQGLLQYVVNGLILGGIIGLTAIGLTLVYGILRLANFAHGDYLTIGAYLAYLYSVTLGMSMPAAFAAAIASSAAMAVAIDRMVWRPMRRRRAGLIPLLITSIGVAFVLRNLVILLWGNAIRTYGYVVEEGMEIYGLRITAVQLWILVSVFLLMFLVHYLLTYTRLGKAMRAAADNTDLAEVSGIDVEGVITRTWLIAAALACTGGIMLGLDTHIKPIMGWSLLLPIFAAVILGGIGNPYGAIAGGMIIGMSQELSVIVIPAHYKPAVSFAIMIAILFLRPEGLFGRR
ncbi:MAG: branched-chain amino acid ABC transporter permease [Methanobacteriota archaeon]|nr:MAG: branched-chain amino acid ABC transporter permease [Euryarchaeota archaeon]